MRPQQGQSGSAQGSFVPERFDRVQPRGFQCRKVAENHAHPPTAAEKRRAITSIPALKTKGTRKTPENQSDPAGPNKYWGHPIMHARKIPI